MRVTSTWASVEMVHARAATADGGPSAAAAHTRPVTANAGASRRSRGV